MPDKILTLKLLKGRYGICRLDNDDFIPEWAKEGDFLSITKTPEELSIVCSQSSIPGNIKSERDWRILKVEGPLDFSLVGILAPISTILAQSGISIFAISTFDTDYILMKDSNVDKAIESLSKEGYNIMKA